MRFYINSHFTYLLISCLHLLHVIKINVVIKMN